MQKRVGSFVFLLLFGCGGWDSGGDGETATTGNVSSSDNWLIPANQVVDGGPGKDGIPALSNPSYLPVDQVVTAPGGLVIGIKTETGAQAYPHDIMDWHEVLNDNLPSGAVVLSYCPLTGSALLWKSRSSDADPTFGVSGLLYNSNLILYDRQTDSNWSQMLVQAVEGQRQSEIPESLPVVEMTVESWREMYPASVVLSRGTGFSRNYDDYPYGSYRTDSNLLFAVDPLDSRLQEKTRVVGIEANGAARAYVIADFKSFIEIINDEINGVPIVVIGSSDGRFGVIRERTLSDGTVLTFSESAEPRPTVMEDDQGNTWDIFGQAVTGARSGERLGLPKSYTAFWFAWAAFFPGSQIYGRN